MPIDWSASRLRWIGLATAAAAALPAISRGDRPRPAFIAAWGLFALLWWWINGDACNRLRPSGRLTALAAIGLVALSLAALGGGAFAATYAVLVAAVAGSVLADRAALVLVAIQAALLPMALLLAGLALRDAAALTLMFAALQIFVVHTAQVARAEKRARRELEAANRRLSEAQSSLAQASRDGERLRIARELHDVLGHHLTALSLTLEAAAHLEGEPREARVAEAQVLVKRLLRDVRQVVSAVRDAPDLRRDLERLVAEAKGPRVQLTMPLGAAETGEPEARALVRCAQEAITNASRHGEAANLAIDLERSDGGWLLTARDDGRGTQAISDDAEPGYGLRGVEERFRELGGWARWGPAEGKGFELRAWLPRGGAA